IQLLTTNALICILVTIKTPPPPPHKIQQQDSNNSNKSKMSSTYRSKYAGEIFLLTDSNWHAWEQAIFIHLQAIGAYGHVRGHAKRPSLPSPPAVPSREQLMDIREWEKMEAKAKGVLLGSTSAQFKLYITGI